MPHEFARHAGRKWRHPGLQSELPRDFSRPTRVIAGSSPSELVYARPHFPPAGQQAVLPIDKPRGWTSFDVIRRLRGILGIRKIGHAGTLDPMATGLLLCLIGRATKLMEHFMMLPKTYSGILRLGETTASFDAETEVEERRYWEHVTQENLHEATIPFLGEIVQLPPMYSAVKIGGKRLYQLARRGETAERRPRTVMVEAFDVIGQCGADVSFRVMCSKGTYIRTLAHDFGRHLGTGAHLVELRRDAIGPYSVEVAWTLEDLTVAASQKEE
jgi:tRNA pseudouridine55 synthase